MAEGKDKLVKPNYDESKLLANAGFNQRKYTERNTYAQDMVISLIQNGYKQNRVAKLTGVGINIVNRLLLGKVRNPQHKDFKKLLSLYCAIRLVDFQQ